MYILYLIFIIIIEQTNKVIAQTNKVVSIKSNPKDFDYMSNDVTHLTVHGHRTIGEISIVRLTNKCNIRCPNIKEIIDERTVGE